MLQEDRCCQCINFSFPIPRRAAHFANYSKRGRGREPFIDQLHGQSRTTLQIFSEPSNVGGPLGVISILVEGQPENKTAGLQRRSASNELRDRHPLSRTALNEPGGGSDHAKRVANRKPDSSLAIVDGQKPSAVTSHERRAGKMTNRRRGARD